MVRPRETPFAFLVPPTPLRAASGQIAFGFLEIIADGRAAIAHRRPETLRRQHPASLRRCAGRHRAPSIDAGACPAHEVGRRARFQFFGGKIANGAAAISLRRSRRDVRDGRWSDGRRAPGWSGLTSRLRTRTQRHCVAIAHAGPDGRCLSTFLRIVGRCWLTPSFPALEPGGELVAHM
jgi:hypothetical protein